MSEMMPDSMLPDAGADAVDWSSMSPSEKAREAARIRWARRRAELEQDMAEDAAMPPADDRVALVRVPITIGDIMRKLQHDAKAGGTAAARELRAWLTQFPPDDAAGDASDLDAPTRAGIAAILAKALAEYEESTAPSTIREGTKDGFDPSLPQVESPGPEDGGTAV